MRLTTDRAVAVVGAVALALAARDTRRAAPAGAGAGPAAGTTATAAGTSPREAAESLLKTLADGKLAPDQLTPYFRAVIAPPQTEDEKKAGYSDAQAREWLQGFSASKFSFLEESKVGNAVVERGRAESPAGKVAFTLRLVPDASGYKIDWLHRSTHIGLVPAPTDPDLA